MSPGLSLSELIEYTSWERGKWEHRLRGYGDTVLEIAAGPHGDGRFGTVGDLIRHIFTAEKRYVERLSGRPLTDQSSVPNGSVEGLFAFSRQSRQELRELVATLPADRWDTPTSFKVLNYSLTTTPRKVVIHILIHECRHWAQVAMLLRLNGMVGEFHDFLLSPVLDAEVGSSSSTAAGTAGDQFFKK